MIGGGTNLKRITEKMLKEIKLTNEDKENTTHYMTQRLRLIEMRKKIQGKELGRVVIR